MDWIMGRYRHVGLEAGVWGTMPGAEEVLNKYLLLSDRSWKEGSWALAGVGCHRCTQAWPSSVEVRGQEGREMGGVAHSKASGSLRSCLAFFFCFCF